MSLFDLDKFLAVDENTCEPSHNAVNLNRGSNEQFTDSQRDSSTRTFTGSPPTTAVVPSFPRSADGIPQVPEALHSFQPGDNELQYREVVIDGNGLPRQAGADSPEGEFIKRYKRRAEENLYIFSKGVLGRFFLTPHFHQDICDFLQNCPPFRKLCLMPREHAKTAIVSGGLPLHILVQSKENNIYFPGLEGSECRILLSGETERMAKKNLRVLKSVLEENKLFRAFWPQRCWDTGKRVKEWSSESIIIPRENEWPDPTIKAVGVGGAITGARPNVLIKDDLVSFKAMNSEVVMQEAIDWHIASRALLDTYEVESGLQSLEFIIGCLTADSQITMLDGTKKRICDVKVGDFVWSPGQDGFMYKRKVEAVIPQGMAETWTISTTRTDVRATGNHPFLISTEGNKLGWKRADQLCVGDLIVSHKTCRSYLTGKKKVESEFCCSSSFNFSTIGRHETPNKNLYGDLNVGRDTFLDSHLRFERVIGVERNKIAEAVWDLTVEGTPSFFANGLAVHNTRWAVFDLYSYIIDNDPSVEVNDAKYHKIIQDGKILWPEKNTLEDIEQLKLEHGSMFYLLYLNSASDPNLTDFTIEDIREFKVINNQITFEGDSRDLFLEKRSGVIHGTGQAQPKEMEKGKPLSLKRLEENLKGGIGCRIRA